MYNQSQCYSITSFVYVNILVLKEIEMSALATMSFTKIYR